MADSKPGGGLDEGAAAKRERGGLGDETDLTSPDDPLAAEPVLGGGAGSLAGLDGGGIAVEAASLGAGAGRGDVGSGTPSDTGGLGGRR